MKAFLFANNKVRKIIECSFLPILLIIVTFLTAFPYLQPGLSGYMPDLQYHLARIEGVRIAIEAGSYPARIYEFFYNGYGYGSPLFYPDIFLIIPALIRIIGFDPITAYKISVCIFSVLLITVTYFSFCYITQNRFFSFVGTSLICLSQFYLADLMNRVGYSEYIAFFLLPLLFVAIYDVFVYEGKKIYLLGISLCGLLLCHTILFFLSFCFTFFVFISLLLVPKYRKKFILVIKPFFLCIFFSIGATAYYLFPLLEQHVWGSFFYQTPWAKVGENVESLKVILFTTRGYFNTIAYVGVGIPIIIGMVTCAIPIIFSKSNKELCRYFFIEGIVLLVLMTDIFPWNILNNTIFNMIQFTYRIYPFALMCIVVGIILFLSKFEFKPKTLPAYTLGVVLLICSFYFGLIQNCYITINPDALLFTEDYLIENATVTGSAEWAPSEFHGKLTNFNSPTEVIDEKENTYSLSHPQYGKYTFTVSDSNVVTYSVPLFCYKGYSAYITDSSGVITRLPVESSSGKVQVSNITNSLGTITVEYSGTLIQKICEVISLLTLISLITLIVIRTIKKKPNIE